MIKHFREEYRFLSNFAPVEVWFDGELYPSVEHAYVAAKTPNKELRKVIQHTETAGKAKALGQGLLLRSDWHNVKIGIMKNLLTQKFSQEEFRNLLLATGDEVIVEGNIWHDNFWGSCVCERCGDVGDNVLGRMLMELREEERGQGRFLF